MKKIALALLLLPLSLMAQTPSITLTPVITGLSRPVFATHCGDSRLFVVEQAGRIKVYDSAYNYLGIYLNVSNIVTQPATGGDERGLLGLAFHPNYAQNGYLYINYTRTVNGQLKSFISRYSVFANNPNKADSLSALEILSFNQPYSNHNGGCLAFGPDGYLYIGTGDGGSGNDPQGNGQKLNTYLAKMLRIDVDNGSPYVVPSDNPFVGTANVNPEIWAYGLRNPWRFSFDRINGNLWIADVGQNNYEEVNVHYNGDPAGDN
ncbi:MAG: PQQ-dependent sugar dehydrogenase, partial [Bacteroidota bacterium]